MSFNDFVIYSHHRRLVCRASHYEEIAVYYGVLWTQLQIFSNGIASGSIIVEQKNPTTPSARENRIDEFELQYLVKLYGSYLSSGRLRKSTIFSEYQQYNVMTPSKLDFMFDVSFLCYVTTLIKAPFNTEEQAPNLLNVSVNSISQHSHVEPNEAMMHPFENVPLSHMRDCLGYRLNLRSDPAARYFLSHLHTLGMFNRLDLDPDLFKDTESDPMTYCSFPIPVMLDPSVNVETLVAAIESCLQDIDIAVNEVGFLLLTRRAWPTGFASEYGLNRLAKAISSWIFAEVRSFAHANKLSSLIFLFVSLG
jgi:hypothetical protein